MKSNKIHWSELVVGGLVASLLLMFLSLLIYSYTVLHINIPACLTATQPFEKGEVISRLDPVTWREKYEVHVLARMWQFEPAEIFVRAGTKVEFYLSSMDVTHGFHIVGTSVNLTAVPGALNYASTTFEKPGEYRIICHEYCGVGHQNMMSKIIVFPAGYIGDPREYQRPLVSTVTDNSNTSKSTNLGKKLFGERGCAACHSIDGNNGVGPTFKGLFGQKVNLQSGETVTADEAYLKESILSPTAKIVKGFQPSMPVVPLTNEEVDSLIDFITSLEK
ncbi:MAG: c-type cytochrome [Deltaproteobacteria bacterium]|nr:c-type cytochrome [Deltaproteobacteria bacterium]